MPNIYQIWSEDPVDLEILSTIQLLGGKASVYDLSKYLSIPKGTISNRLKKLVDKGVLEGPNEVIEHGRLKKLYSLKQPLRLEGREKKAWFEAKCLEEDISILRYQNRQLNEVLKEEPSKFELLIKFLCGMLELKDNIVKIPEKTIERLIQNRKYELCYKAKELVEIAGEEETLNLLEAISKAIKKDSLYELEEELDPRARK